MSNKKNPSLNKGGGLIHHLSPYNTVLKIIPSKRGPSQMATNQPHHVRGSFNDLHNEGWSNPQPGDLALNVFLAPEEYKHLELRKSQLELMKPLGER